MEIQRMAGSNALSLPSSKRLDAVSKEKLGWMLAQLAAAYPHQDMAEAADMYQLGYEVLSIEFGLDRVELAFRHCTTHTKFYPHPADVREILENMAAKTKQQLLKEHPYVPCGKCSDGLVRVPADHHHTYSYVDWCQCKLRWRAEHRAIERGESPTAGDRKTAAGGGQ